MPLTAPARVIGRAVSFALAFALAFAAASAVAQDPVGSGYPNRAVKVIAPSSPGGGFDLVGRVLAQKLSEQLGQPFVVENRPGAGTLVGTQAVVKSAADGYTLLVGGLSNIALNMGMYKAPGYDALVDLVPISLVVSHSYMLVGRKDLPHSSLTEILAFARANPGKLVFATSGSGSGQHVGAAIILKETGVDMLMVPYKGAQPVYQDLLAGRVDLFYDNTTTARPYVESGQVKGVAVSSKDRANGLSQVPTIAESGLPAWEMESWFGWFAPAKTPQPVLDRLRSEIDKATRSAEVRSRLEQGSGRSLRLSVAETESLLRSEVPKWVGLIRKAGVTVD